MRRKHKKDAVCYVYALVDPDSDEIRYVGRTNNPDRRLDEHNKNYVISGIKSYWLEELADSEKKPVMRILETTILKEVAKREIFWIKNLTSQGCKLLNIANGNIKKEKQIKEKKPVLNIQLPVELHEQFKAYAKAQGEPMRFFVQQDIKTRLNKKSATLSLRRPKAATGNVFPVEQWAIYKDQPDKSLSCANAEETIV